MGLHTMKSAAKKEKNKKKNERFGKVKLPIKDTSSIINPDVSSLHKRINKSVSTLYQVSKLLETGTNEVKSILLHECDLIYECRTCRSLFRSIIDLISHKRKYCRKKFVILSDENLLSNSNITIMKETVKNDGIPKNQIFKECPQKNDLSTLADMPNKKQEENTESNLFHEIKIENELLDTSNKQHIYLESIDTNYSTYQSIKSLDAPVTTDMMKTEIIELQDTIDQSTKTLEGQISENQLEKSDSPIQMDMNDEENEVLTPRLSSSDLICNLCKTVFSTKKTLNVHMKTLHTAQRISYVCPCCKSTFANTWGVHRHLYKVHKKTHEQVRKLRSLVQENVENKEASMTKGIRNTRRTKTSKSVLKNCSSFDVTNNNKYQESIGSNIELRNYDRYKERLTTISSSHSQYHQMPINTSNESITNIEHSDKGLSDEIPISNRSEIENIDTTDCNMTTMCVKELWDASEKISSEVYKPLEIRVKDISNLAKEDRNMLEESHNLSNCNSTNNKNDFTSSVTQNINENESFIANENSNHLVSEKNSSDIICIKKEQLKSLAPRLRYKNQELLSCYVKTFSIDSKEKNVVKEQEDKSSLQSSSIIRSDKKDQTSLMESKIATMTNLRKMQCLPCKRKFTSLTNLRRHMAIHIGWHRYRCKLCSFKCFAKCDCITHCNKVHNAQNEREMIAELVIEIPHDKYETDNKNIITEVMNTKEKPNNSNIVLDIVSSKQSKTFLDESNESNNSNAYVTLQKNTIVYEAAESHGNKYEDVDIKNESIKIMMMENSSDCMTNNLEKLNTNPNLEQIVMEVILGSSDTNNTKQADSNEAILKTDSNIKDHTKNDENNTAFIVESKEKSYTSVSSSNLKKQRPMRNRMKALNTDFVYDLKKIGKSMLFREKRALFNDCEALDVRKKSKLYK